MQLQSRSLRDYTLKEIIITQGFARFAMRWRGETAFPVTGDTGEEFCGRTLETPGVKHLVMILDALHYCIQNLSTSIFRFKVPVLELSGVPSRRHGALRRDEHA